MRNVDSRSSELDDLPPGSGRVGAARGGGRDGRDRDAGRGGRGSRDGAAGRGSAPARAGGKAGGRGGAHSAGGQRRPRQHAGGRSVRSARRKLARDRRRNHRLARRTAFGRHPFRTALLVVVLALAPVWWSLGSALTNPSLGSSLSARGAEWVRGHGGNGIVNWIENEWYSHHQPPVGGAPPKGAIPPPVSGSASSAGSGQPAGGGGSAAATAGSASPGAGSGSTAGSAGKSGSSAGSAGSGSAGSGTGGASATKAGSATGTGTGTPAGLAALPTPAPIVPLANPPIPGEGDWHPVGRLVDGKAAVYEAFLRPDPIHTSLVAGVAWMDTKLLRATLYSGSTIPGGGPYRDTAPIEPAAARSLVAAFNAGFVMSSAEGGYYTEGKTIFPLRTGAASIVIYKNGSITVGAWGSQVRMTPDVVSVRQNLDLLVNNGKAVPGLNPNDTTQWGFTLGNAVYVWRSGLGVTANGALVYVGGPGLNITTLANLLVRAGAVRAMELDINTDWVSYSTYKPATPNGAATPSNGTELLSDMLGTPARWFETWWSRDFVTMSAR